MLVHLHLSLWGFEERETLMTFYERASGSRLHANYFRAGRCSSRFTSWIEKDIGKFCEHISLKLLNDLESLVN